MSVWYKHENTSIELALERTFGKDKIMALLGRLPINGLVLHSVGILFEFAMAHSSPEMSSASSQPTRKIIMAY